MKKGKTVHMTNIIKIEINAGDNMQMDQKPKKED
jgi:hypothetical protein